VRVAERILTIISGAVFATALGLLVFIYGTDYGVLYTPVLLWEGLEWICVFSGISLLVGLTAWIRRARKPKSISNLIARSVACALLNLIAIVMLSGFFEPFFDENARGNQHYVYTSPEGTNQIVVYFTLWGETMHAYPMLNRWIYKEADNGYVEVKNDNPWEAYLQEDEYTVEWPSERQAVVTVNWLPDDSDGPQRIVVDF